MSKPKAKKIMPIILVAPERKIGEEFVAVFSNSEYAGVVDMHTNIDGQSCTYPIRTPKAGEWTDEFRKLMGKEINVVKIAYGKDLDKVRLIPLQPATIQPATIKDA